MFDNANIIDVSEATFEEDVLQRSYEVTVLVDFWAPWCGPCRVLGPILERLANEADSNFVLAKLNVDENPSLSMQYQVQGIPAVKAFRDGAVIDEFVGAQPEAQIRRFLSRVAPAESDIELEEAESLLGDGQWTQAASTFRELPASPRTTLGLAKALLGEGEGCEARELLETITDAPAYVQAQQLLPLAQYLCDFEAAEIDDPQLAPIEAQYRRAADLLRRGNIAAALDGLLDVLRADKRYRDGQAKDVVVAIFTLLGDDDPLTREYRSQLAMVLF